MIRIGTRESQLAVWQATLVKQLLEKSGVSSELVYIKSEGDIDVVTPLYELGIQGVFTRTLDASLLAGKIDIAVHSMKDVPTQLARGLAQSAVLERGAYHDVFVPKEDSLFLNDLQSQAIIATSSVRRRAQWLRRYPNHIIENIRGNINTRLQKVYESHWNGAVFAAAGLQRIELLPANAVTLDWMLPSPAQGAILVVCRTDDKEILNVCSSLHHHETAICVKMERDFLQKLKGGCTAPISAIAISKVEVIHFRGSVLSIDGKTIFEVDETIKPGDFETAGFAMAELLIAKGAGALISQIREQNPI